MSNQTRRGGERNITDTSGSLDQRIIGGEFRPVDRLKVTSDGTVNEFKFNQSILGDSAKLVC